MTSRQKSAPLSQIATAIGLAQEAGVASEDKLAEEAFATKPAKAGSTNGGDSEMSASLPKPTKEFVDRINALAPDDSELTVIEG